MYASVLSDWNAAKMGPNGMCSANWPGRCGEKGLVFGVSNHRAEHFFFFDGGLKSEADVTDPRWADFYGRRIPLRLIWGTWKLTHQPRLTWKIGWHATANWSTNTSHNWFGSTGGSKTGRLNRT